MNKRGISPLIATVLLISFTIVISVVITAWIRSGLETQLQSGSEKIASATACLSTKVDIPPKGYVKQQMIKILRFLLIIKEIIQ